MGKSVSSKHLVFLPGRKFIAELFPSLGNKYASFLLLPSPIPGQKKDRGKKMPELTPSSIQSDGIERGNLAWCIVLTLFLWVFLVAQGSWGLVSRTVDWGYWCSLQAYLTRALVMALSVLGPLGIHWPQGKGLVWFHISVRRLSALKSPSWSKSYDQLAYWIQISSLAGSREVGQWILIQELVENRG